MPAIKTEKQRYARGLKRRKQVLGAKYVPYKQPGKMSPRA